MLMKLTPDQMWRHSRRYFHPKRGLSNSWELEWEKWMLKRNFPSRCYWSWEIIFLWLDNFSMPFSYSLTIKLGEGPIRKNCLHLNEIANTFGRINFKQLILENLNLLEFHTGSVYNWGLWPLGSPLSNLLLLSRINIVLKKKFS